MLNKKNKNCTWISIMDIFKGILSSLVSNYFRYFQYFIRALENHGKCTHERESWKKYC